MSWTRLLKILMPFLKLHFTSFVLATFTHDSSAQCVEYYRMWEFTGVLLHCSTLTITHDLKKARYLITRVYLWCTTCKCLVRLSLKQLI